MAYIIQSLKKINLKKSNDIDKEVNVNKIFIFIIILSAIVIAVDYALIIKYINMIKNSHYFIAKILWILKIYLTFINYFFFMSCSIW